MHILLESHLHFFFDKNRDLGLLSGLHTQK